MLSAREALSRIVQCRSCIKLTLAIFYSDPDLLRGFFGPKLDSHAPGIFVSAFSTMETLPASRSISPNRVSCALRVAVCVSTLEGQSSVTVGKSVSTSRFRLTIVSANVKVIP